MSPILPTPAVMVAYLDRRSSGSTYHAVWASPEAGALLDGLVTVQVTGARG